MAEKKEECSFAEKWLTLFREHTIENTQFERDFGQECEDLGFLMDMGQIYRDETGLELYDAEGLGEIDPSRLSVEVLGSALYSSWRAFTHWMRSPLTEARIRVWFILLLDLLYKKTTASRKSATFTGIPEKVQLISFKRLSLPDMFDDEVEQHITITRNGMCYMSAYSRDEAWNKESTGKKQLSIGKDKAFEILEAFSSLFSFTEEEGVAYDSSWALVITDRFGDKYKFASSMVPFHLLRELSPLSEDIRSALSDMSLMVLDGECGKDEIEMLDFEYTSADEGGTRENITLERECGTLIYEKEVGPDYRAKREFRVGDEIEEILDEIYEEKLFRDRPSRPRDLIDRSWRVDIHYRKRGDVTLGGVFDMNGLPKSFPVFADKIARFLDMYAPSEDILDPELYGKRRRREDEFMVCSVQFKPEAPTYYYLSTDDTLKAGDLVEVQCTDTELTNTGIIRRIELYTKKESPVDVEKASWIVRRAKAK